MQFTDIIFSLFLFTVFSLYWLVLRGRTRWQNVLLLTASYIFYGWWDWRFLGLIILTTASTFITGLFGRNKYGKLLTGCNIVLNLGILILFKYFNFFSENLTRLLSLFGIGLDWFTIDVLLPVGISFYTFQAISYSVDVYRRNVSPCRDAVSFFTFIAYFPQLVAGPIERASQLLTQIMRPRSWDRSQATSGMRLIMFGLLKKLCIADILAIYVEHIYTGSSLSPVMVLVGGILFSIEIYCDFSAYSEIARGTSRLLGIELMANFRFPYFSRNILEFWRRWHISLMEWFRDYLYIPLGGNRKGTVRTMINTVIIFLLSGLWHGAAWNFIIWGAYWSVAYIISKFILNQRSLHTPLSFKDIPDMIATFGVVSLGFFFFRCNTAVEIISGLSGCWIYFAVFCGGWLTLKMLTCRKGLFLSAAIISFIAFLSAIYIYIPHWYLLLKWWWILPAATVFVSEWLARNQDYPLQVMSTHTWKRMIFYWICIFFIVISEPTEMTFIYFQF